MENLYPLSLDPGLNTLCCVNTTRIENSILIFQMPQGYLPASSWYLLNLMLLYFSNHHILLFHTVSDSVSHKGSGAEERTGPQSRAVTQG